jgi:hypothetical protein
MATTEDRIKAKVSGRNEAASLCELLFLSDGTPPWADGTGEDFAEAFLAEVQARLPQRREAQPEKPAETPIARLGATAMPFGTHNGETFDEVSLEYLGWLCGAQEDFFRQLRAYLKHPELEVRRGGR